jgi:HPt (histidine-containing phosphotransfer) domain-containing protein
MPSNSVAWHLRELAAAARELEKEPDSQKSTRVMKKLAAHYDAWAERVERTEDDRRELTIHIERCKIVLEATENVVCKAVLADLIKYLEGKLRAAGGSKSRPEDNLAPTPFPPS